MFNPKDYMTPKEVQQKTGAKAMDNVWAWIRENKLPSTKFGRNYLIARKDFEKFWETHRPVFEKYQKTHQK